MQLSRRSHAHLSSVTRDPVSPALPSEQPSPTAQAGAEPGVEPGAVQASRLQIPAVRAPDKRDLDRGEL